MKRDLLPAVERTDVLRERIRDEVLDRRCLICRKLLREHRGLRNFRFNNETRRYEVEYRCAGREG